MVAPVANAKNVVDSIGTSAQNQTEYVHKTTHYLSLSGYRNLLEYTESDRRPKVGWFSFGAAAGGPLYSLSNSSRQAVISGRLAVILAAEYQ
jgi:hypothetical protein